MGLSVIVSLLFISFIFCLAVLSVESRFTVFWAIPIFLFVLAIIGVKGGSKVYSEIPIHSTFRTNGVLTALYYEDDTLEPVSSKVYSMYCEKDECLTILKKEEFTAWSESYGSSKTLIRKLDFPKDSK